MFIIVYVFKEGIQLKTSEILMQVWFLRSNIFIRYISNPIWSFSYTDMIYLPFLKVWKL